MHGGATTVIHELEHQEAREDMFESKQGIRHLTSYHTFPFSLDNPAIQAAYAHRTKRNTVNSFAKQE